MHILWCTRAAHTQLAWDLYRLYRNGRHANAQRLFPFPPATGGLQGSVCVREHLYAHLCVCEREGLSVRACARAWVPACM